MYPDPTLLFSARGSQDPKTHRRAVHGGKPRVRDHGKRSPPGIGVIAAAALASAAGSSLFTAPPSLWFIATTTTAVIIAHHHVLAPLGSARVALPSPITACVRLGVQAILRLICDP